MGNRTKLCLIHSIAVAAADDAAVYFYYYCCCLFFNENLKKLKQKPKNVL